MMHSKRQNYRRFGWLVPLQDPEGLCRLAMAVGMDGGMDGGMGGGMGGGMHGGYGAKELVSISRIGFDATNICIYMHIYIYIYIRRPLQ